MKIKNLIAVTILMLLSTPAVYARADVYEDFDTSLVQGIEYTYQEPKKILFTQIEGRYDTLALSPKEFLDTVYYYSITKLKLGNIPFHYALDESGNVYKTANYDALKITDESYIVIAYLSNNGQLNSNASNSLFKLVEELSYLYGLEEYDINNYSILQSESSFSKLKLIEPNKLFVDSLAVALKDWEGYDREHLKYSASIESVETPEAVVIGNDLSVKLSIKNSNDFVWTSDKYPIYISVKDSEESIFAVNEVWDSFSKATHVDSDEFLLPGEVLEIEFELDPKVAPGDYTETFTILKFVDEVFSNSEFTVKFKVEKGEQDIVRIDSPEAGYVNIRNCRRFSCEQVDVVNDGEVFPVIEYDESCWYKIRYAKDKEGWFYCPFAEKIE
ncbi:MAG: SH3 domain-containing protein [Candidatus Dojkabacteria bacterium]|nr:SH3 domain-containing protein [Candidatus Dojkabacteria bacterium]